MPELSGEAPNLDSLDEKGIGELKERMRNGDDVSAPVKPAETVETKPVEQPKADADAATGAVDDDQEPAGGETPKPRSETVSFGQFDRERNRRKEAEARAEQATADNARVLQRLADLEKRLTEPKTEPASPLDPNLQPIEFMADLGKKFDEFRTETLAEKTAREEQQQRQSQVDRAMTYAREEFGTAAKADPELQGAYNALLESFAREMQVSGVPDTEIRGKLAELEQAHIFHALNSKIPLAKYVKDLASIRGYRPEPAKPVVPAAPEPVVDDLSAIKRAAASLSSTGGAAARTGLPTPQDIIEMSPAQYAKFREKHTLSDIYSR